MQIYLKKIFNVLNNNKLKKFNLKLILMIVGLIKFERKLCIKFNNIILFV